MSSSGVSLLQMPKIPMEHILEYLNFQSILILRKVCHDLRNFIDVTKPASHLTKIHVNVYREKFFVDLFLPKSTCIRYLKNGEGCFVKNEKSAGQAEKAINEDFVTVFCKDFEIVLRHQKVVLEEFRIDFVSSHTEERFLKSLTKTLKSMNHLLQVESLDMGVNNHNEILSVLPFMDPETLERIDIHESSDERDTVVLNLDEIGQLEQWKQAAMLWINGFQIPDPSQNLKHFYYITFRSQDFYTKDLILLKEIFLSSSTLTEMQIDLSGTKGDVIRRRLIEAFGQPFVDLNRNWFFRIPDTNQFLEITQQCIDINFARIVQSDVPQNAVILN